MHHPPGRKPPAGSDRRLAGPNRAVLGDPPVGVRHEFLSADRGQGSRHPTAMPELFVGGVDNYIGAGGGQIPLDNDHRPIRQDSAPQFCAYQRGSLSHGGDLFGLLVGNLYPELVLHSHQQLHHTE